MGEKFFQDARILNKMGNKNMLINEHWYRSSY